MTIDDLKYDNLLGFAWEMNERDCFTLTREFFKQNFDIDIPDVARPNNWSSDNLDLIGLIHSKAGFTKVTEMWDDLRPGDVLACSVQSSNPNHLAIYIGNNELLHHRLGVNSSVETLRPFWRMTTGYILRHPDVPDLRPVLPDANLEDLISARFRL